MDYSKIAAEIDAKFEAMDRDGVLRPTMIEIGRDWTRKSRSGLLGKSRQGPMNESQQRSEKATAFGLLDALTRGGGLALDHVALHIVVCQACVHG